MYRILFPFLTVLIVIAGWAALSQAPAYAGGTPGSGDANCSGAVDPVDAAFILQFSVGLLSSLPCQDEADANVDGTADSLDATLVLQFAAGLVLGLPFPIVPQPILEAVLDVAAETLDVPRESVSVVAIETMVWADLCMGLAEPDELCLQAITEGWRITIRAGPRGGIWHAASEFPSIRLAKLF